jgi:hypothetical protein
MLTPGKIDPQQLLASPVPLSQHNLSGFAQLFKPLQYRRKMQSLGPGQPSDASPFLLRYAGHKALCYLSRRPGTAALLPLPLLLPLQRTAVQSVRHAVHSYDLRNQGWQ